MFRNVISRVGIQSRITNVRFITEKLEVNNVEKTINQVTLLGRVGAAPQERGSDQHPVVTFSIATHINYRYENGEYMQKTDWHKIFVFKPNLRQTVSNYMKKGQRVLVSGRLSNGEFKDEGGNDKTSTVVVADNVIFFNT